MRKGTWIALFLALLVALPAMNADAQAVKKYKFVVITHATAVPFFVPVRKGAMPSPLQHWTGRATGRQEPTEQVLFV